MMNDGTQKKIICRAPSCQFEVRDNEEEELVTIILDHASRKHQINLPVESVQAAIQPIDETSEGSH